MGSLGNWMNYSACFPEAEERSPWPPFHVAQGFPKEESIASLFFGGRYMLAGFGPRDTWREEFRRVFAGCEQHLPPLFVMDPLCARGFVERGFDTREKLQVWFSENGRMRARVLGQSVGADAAPPACRGGCRALCEQVAGEARRVDPPFRARGDPHRRRRRRDAAGVAHVRRFLQEVSVDRPMAVSRPIARLDRRNRIVQRLWSALRSENAERLDLVFDEARPVRSTGDMPPWYTSKPCDPAAHSHLNVCVNDGTWEARVAFQLDRHPRVAAWAKNDHLGFEVPYLYRGAHRKYRPDLFVRLASGKTVILEVTRQDDEEQQTKRRYLNEWLQAVNAHGGSGVWGWDVLLDPNDLVPILTKAAQEDTSSPTTAHREPAAT
jgi:hypothetical protein